MTGADLIVEYLIREDVPYVFGLCGHGNVGLLEALRRRSDAITFISVHHEQAAGHMADAYFRIAHRPAAVLTSCGPGACNLPVALASAMMDSAAMLVLTGNVPTEQFNRGAFQETYRFFQADFPSVVRPYVKRSFQPTRVEMLPLALRQAFRTMRVGRTGPVHLDVPLNLFSEAAEDVEIPDPEGWTKRLESAPGAEGDAIERAADLLLNAKRPLILAGHGLILSEGCDVLTRLVSDLGIPVANTPNGKGALDMRHELSLGDVGRNGTYPANQAAKSCDVLLALGVHFDDRVSSSWIPGYTFNIPPTQLIHVDIDPEELGRNYPVAMGILGDARTVLQQLGAALLARTALPRPDWKAWQARLAGWQREWEAYLETQAHQPANPIHPERLIHTLRRILPEDGILLADVGVHHNWLVQRWPAYRPQTMLQSWGFASMGFGVCGVLGAKLAAPNRPCVAVVGDGGFLMTSHAVATAVEYDLDVTWVIWNNGGYISIRDLQLAHWGHEYGTTFRRERRGEAYTPDFVGLARSMGAEAVRVTDAAKLEAALNQALVTPRPYVVEVVVDAEARPAAVGTWALPPLPHPEPEFPPRSRGKEDVT